MIWGSEVWILASKCCALNPGLAITSYVTWENDFTTLYLSIYVDKTEMKFFVSTLNCNKRYARDEFLTVKKRFDKEGGIDKELL